MTSITLCQKLIEAPKEVTAAAFVCEPKRVIAIDSNSNSNNSNNDYDRQSHSDQNLARGQGVCMKSEEIQPQIRKQQAGDTSNMISYTDPNNNQTKCRACSSDSEQITQHNRNHQVAPLASLDCSITEPVDCDSTNSRTTPTYTPTLSGYFDCDQLSDMIDDSLFEITNAGCSSQSVLLQKQKQKQHQQQHNPGQILLNTDKTTSTHYDNSTKNDLNNGNKNVFRPDERGDDSQTPTNEPVMNQDRRRHQNQHQTVADSSLTEPVKTSHIIQAKTLVNYYRPYDYSSTSKIPSNTLTNRNVNSIRILTETNDSSPPNNSSINKQRSKSARILSSSNTSSSSSTRNNRPTSTQVTSQQADDHHHHHHHHHHRHRHRNHLRHHQHNDYRYHHKDQTTSSGDTTCQQQQQQRARRKTRSNPDVRDDNEIRNLTNEANDSLCAICREQEDKKKKEGKKRFTFSLFNLFTGGGGSSTICIHKQNPATDQTTSSMKQGTNQIKGGPLSPASSDSSAVSSHSSASSPSSNANANSAPSSSSSSDSSPFNSASNPSSTNLSSAEMAGGETIDKSSLLTSPQRLIGGAHTRGKSKTSKNGAGSHIKSRDSIRLTNQRKQRNIKTENQQQQHNFKLSTSLNNFQNNNDLKPNTEILLDFPGKEQQAGNSNITAGELRGSQSSYSLQQQQRRCSGKGLNGARLQQQQQRQAKCVKFTTPVMILPSNSNHKTSGTQSNLPPADLQPSAPIIKRSVPKSSSYSQTESNKNLDEILARYEENTSLISEINERLKLTETIASPMSVLDVELGNRQKEPQQGDQQPLQNETLITSDTAIVCDQALSTGSNCY